MSFLSPTSAKDIQLLRSLSTVQSLVCAKCILRSQWILHASNFVYIMDCLRVE